MLPNCVRAPGNVTTGVQFVSSVTAEMLRLKAPTPVELESAAVTTTVKYPGSRARRRPDKYRSPQPIPPLDWSKISSLPAMRLFQGLGGLKAPASPGPLVPLVRYMSMTESDKAPSPVGASQPGPAHKDAMTVAFVQPDKYTS